MDINSLAKEKEDLHEEENSVSYLYNGHILNSHYPSSQLKSLGSARPRTIGLHPIVPPSIEQLFLKRLLRYIVRVAVIACAYKAGVPPLPSQTQEPMEQRGQGWGLKPKERKAVEEYAIKKAMKYYRKWKPRRTEREGIGADLEITKEEKKEWIEVKGTTGELPRFDFYKTEIDRFLKYPTRTHLFALLQVKLSKKNMRASGGVLYVEKSVGKKLYKRYYPQPISFRVDFGET